jgi:hypothetical protein
MVSKRKESLTSKDAVTVNYTSKNRIPQLRYYAPHKLRYVMWKNQSGIEMEAQKPQEPSHLAGVLDRNCGTTNRVCPHPLRSRVGR